MAPLADYSMGGSDVASKNSDPKAQVKEYALGKYQGLVSRADKFVDEGKEAAQHPQPYSPTAEDTALVNVVTRKHLLAPQKIEKCKEYHEAAAWLPDPPSFRDALICVGNLPEERIPKFKADSPKPKAAPGVNQAYGAVAVRLGFATQNQVDQCLAAIKPEQASGLVIHRLLASHGLIKQEQHAAIVKQLRAAAASKRSGGH